MTEKKATKLMKQLDGTEEPVLITLHSEGGALVEGLALYGSLKKHQSKYGASYAYVPACCHSAAILPLIACKHRAASEDAWFCIHEGIAEIKEANASIIRVEHDRLMQLEQQYNEILARHTKLPVATWAKLAKEHTYLTAAEALQYGLIDTVVRST